MASSNNKRDDIEAMLPWYEKGTLPAKDARLVQEHLESDPDLARSLALIREEVTETIEANERAGMPGSAGYDRLMASIAAEAKPARMFASEGAVNLLSRIFGRGASPWMPAAAFAACLVILVQAATLGVLLWPESPSETGLAKGGSSATAEAGSYALVRFTESAKASDISALLRSFNAVIVDGPKPGSVYRIKLSPQSLKDDEREQILRQIRARSDIISFAAVSG